MRKNEIAYLFLVTTMVLAIFALSLHRFSEIKGSSHEGPATKSMGRPRNINSEQMRILINQGRLSNKDAKFSTADPAMERPQQAMPSKK